MRIRVNLAGVLVPAALVACLFSLTAPANAAGGGVAFGVEEQEDVKKGPDKAEAANPVSDGTDLLFPPGFDEFTDKLFYGPKGKISPSAQGTAMAGEPMRPSRLSLRLYGGFSRLAAGDVNEGCDGYFELIELYDALGMGTALGGYSPIHAGYNFGADLVFQLTPNIGVGIGAGYLGSSKSSLVTLSADEEEITITGTPKLSAMPIRLAVFLTLPLGGKINLTADAGAAYYAALKLKAKQRLGFTAGNWVDLSISANRSSLSDNLGFQGSLGLEYKISPKMGFFVEAVGRYASFKNFAAATGTTGASTGGTVTTEGKIYLQTNTIPGIGTWSSFTVEEVPPTPDPPDVTYREPKIDLSGFSLQAGIRIRF